MSRIEIAAEVAEDFERILVEHAVDDAHARIGDIIEAINAALPASSRRK